MNAEMVLEFLVAQTWQVTLLAGLVWLGTRLLGTRHCHLSHALWLLVLLKCMTPPIWSSPTGVFSWLEAQRTWHTSPASNVAESGSATSIISYRFNTNQAERSRSAALSLARRKPGRPYIDLRTALVSIWIAGGSICLLFTLIRYRRFRRLAEQGTWISDGPLAELKKQLCQQLGIRKSIALIATNHPIAPTVLGFWKCRIIVPASMIRQFRLEELKPILAHELIHIRRWDLYWSWLQVGAQTLFWFNPLIRLATYRVTQVSEQCCDQETVLGLGCSPKTYASALVAVVEHNHGLVVAPSLPGVRPIDITFTRLERVMNLRQGSCSWTPVWVWIVFILAGTILLPGAATSKAQESAAEVPAVGSPLVTLPVPAVKDLVRAEYDVHALLQQLKDHSNPAEQLLRHLPKLEQTLPIASPIPHSQLHNSLPSMKIVDDQLLVHATKEFQAKVADIVNGLHTFGFTQIVLNTTMFEVQRDRFLAMVEEWPNEKGFAILNRRDVDQLMAQFESNSGDIILSSPTAIVTNGMAATISTGAEVPYVSGAKRIAGSKTYQPDVSSVSIGNTIALQPRIQNNNTLDLHCQIERARLEGFTEWTESSNDKQVEPRKIQIPDITVTKTKCDVNLQEGAYLLVGEFWAPKEGAEQFVGAIVTAQIGVHDEATADARSLMRLPTRR